jgi:hypothetical protein
MALRTEVLEGFSAVLMGGVLVCAACSDEPSAAGSSDSGVEPSKLLSALDASDSVLLCDWTASLLGGYGYRATCPDPKLEYYAAPDQATCLSSMSSSCAATVAEFESCCKEVARDPCNGVTIWQSASGCAGMRKCGTP